MTDPIRRRWFATARAAGLGDEERLDAALADVVARHDEPHRRYHTIEHVGEVLQTIRALADPADPGVTFRLDRDEDYVAVCFAGFLHDVVHDPTSSTNEADSAAYATDLLGGLGLDRAVVTEVARLIELTAGHTVTQGDDNGAVLADADLAILAARRGRYERYADDIRAEYAHVPDDAYRSGRLGVLEGFAERGSIYHCHLMVTRCDAPARENLRWEIERHTLAASTT